MQDLANRTIAIKNPTADKLLSILTEDELTVFQNVGTNLNKHLIFTMSIKEI